MSELIDLKHAHAMRLAKLILYADSLGYQLGGGDWLRDQRCNYGHKKSLHKLGLATDLNLYKGGVWLELTSDHSILGEYWMAMGGTWGGGWGDGNHYSTEYKGMR